MGCAYTRACAPPTDPPGPPPHSHTTPPPHPLVWSALRTPAAHAHLPANTDAMGRKVPLRGWPPSSICSRDKCASCLHLARYSPGTGRLPRASRMLLSTLSGSTDLAHLRVKLVASSVRHTACVRGVGGRVGGGPVAACARRLYKGPLTHAARGTLSERFVSVCMRRGHPTSHPTSLARRCAVSTLAPGSSQASGTTRCTCTQSCAARPAQVV